MSRAQIVDCKDCYLSGSIFVCRIYERYNYTTQKSEDKYTVEDTKSDMDNRDFINEAIDYLTVDENEYESQSGEYVEEGYAYIRENGNTITIRCIGEFECTICDITGETVNITDAKYCEVAEKLNKPVEYYRYNENRNKVENTVYIDEDDEDALDPALDELLSSKEFVDTWTDGDVIRFEEFDLIYDINGYNYGYVNNSELGNDHIQYRTINNKGEIIAIVKFNEFD